jgi:penicillin-insensitive murein DD-endopeptidase
MVKREITSLLPTACSMLALGLGCSRAPSPLSPCLLGPMIGAPAHGVLVEGRELPASGPGFRWLNPMGHHYGVPRLVRAIESAAAAVQADRPGGAPLVVGDLSARAGGHLSGHRSHRTGRDADLLFFVETPSGEPVENPGFLHFDADGLALVPSELGGPRYVRIDLPREWSLIKALMGSRDANVQWLFVSTPVEGLLTEYARARGEDVALLWHAESVMQQPGDSLPHDDHLHLRTACLPEEAIGGCEGGGPYWSWLPELPRSPPEESDESLLLALFAPMERAIPASTITLPSRDEAVRGIEGSAAH